MVVPPLADMSEVSSLVVIGCGNPNRTDDGVGPEVIARLRKADLPDDVRLFDGGTDGMGVLYQARGVSHLVVIDAKAPESEPGAIYDVPGAVLEVPPPQSLNLHDFRWDHALFAGRQIYGDDFPDNVKVFLIEAESLALGLGLSDAVSASADQVCARIVDLVQNPNNEAWK